MTTTSCLTLQRFIKKSDKNAVKSINKEAQTIECLTRSTAFITLKDHKDSLIDNPKCRLLNPAKTQIGKVSTIELDKITTIRSSSAMDQWRNPFSVIEWCQNLSKRMISKFPNFDIIDFYLSITEKH